MVSSVLASCLWVLAASGTAMLPMRRQMAPGLALLGSAPVLIAWLGADFGWWAVGGALLAFASMFRRPLGALLRWALGRGKAA
ncbi:MAG TPA: DUF2484 family protein [Rubellimicrobium sp.]|nr:DUF2484 family protein [Rubellimicrobium sp.]